MKKVSLNESVNRNTIMDAVNNKSVVTIYYDGDHIINKGYRDIEPFCYGRSKWGHDSIRAWQTEGVSDTPQGKVGDELTKIPGWRMFRVDRIKSFEISDEVFTVSRPKFNPKDSDMTTIYVAASFDGSDPVQNVQNEPTVTPSPTAPAPTTPQPTTPATPKSDPSKPVSQNTTVKRNFLQRIADRFKSFLSR